MSMSFIRDQRSAKTCPVKIPKMDQMLPDRLSRNNARKYRLDGQHEMVLIVESEDPKYRENFMLEFALSVSVEV